MKNLLSKENHWSSQHVKNQFLCAWGVKDSTQKYVQQCTYAYALDTEAPAQTDWLFLPVRKTVLPPLQMAEVKKLKQRFAERVMGVSSEPWEALERAAVDMAIDYNMPHLCPHCAAAVVQENWAQIQGHRYKAFRHCGQEFTTLDIWETFSHIMRSVITDLPAASAISPQPIRPETLFGIYSLESLCVVIHPRYVAMGPQNNYTHFALNNYQETKDTPAMNISAYDEHATLLYNMGIITKEWWKSLVKTMREVHYMRTGQQNNFPNQEFERYLSRIYQMMVNHNIEQRYDIKTTEKENEVWGSKIESNDSWAQKEHIANRERIDRIEKDLMAALEEEKRLHKCTWETGKTWEAKTKQLTKKCKFYQTVAKKAQKDQTAIAKTADELMNTKAKITVLEEKEVTAKETIARLEKTLASTKSELASAREALASAKKDAAQALTSDREESASAKNAQKLLDTANKEITDLKKKIGELQSLPAKTEPLPPAAQPHHDEELKELKREAQEIYIELTKKLENLSGDLQKTTSSPLEAADTHSAPRQIEHPRALHSEAPEEAPRNPTSVPQCAAQKTSEEHVVTQQCKRKSASAPQQAVPQQAAPQQAAPQQAAPQQTVPQQTAPQQAVPGAAKPAPCVPKKKEQETKEQMTQALIKKFSGQSKEDRAKYFCCRILGPLSGYGPITPTIRNRLADACEIPRSQLVMAERIDTTVTQLFCTRKYLDNLYIGLRHISAMLKPITLRLLINCNPLSTEGIVGKSSDELLAIVQKKAHNLLKHAPSTHMPTTKLAEGFCKAETVKDFEAFFKRYQGALNTPSNICGYALDLEGSESCSPK